MANPRAVALEWLTQVIDKGRSVNQILSDPNNQLDPQQQALTKQLLFGSLRYYFQLRTLADTLLNKPLKAKDTDVLLVIILGLYQLKYLSTPDHAAISESVELTRELNKPWASGMVNAVLRNYQRQKPELEQKLQKSLQFQFAHPGWLVKKLKQDWPQQAEQIIDANNLQAPMVIRVNTLKTEFADYLQLLEEQNILATAHPLARDGIVLDKAVDVYQLPGFEQGLVTVQDAAAQLAGELLPLEAGDVVLDGCAAPGGKTTLLLQRQPNIRLTAVELSPKRAQKISQTLERLGMDCRLVCADILDTQTWWDNQLFDKILLDVPCSASGVIRRNPDIKVHRKVTDIAPLVELQSKILKTCWQLLKPGGVLVYATCSVFKDENENQIAQFLQENEAQVVNMPEQLHHQLTGRASYGYQILPGEQQMDGFYLCGLRKTHT